MHRRRETHWDMGGRTQLVSALTAFEIVKKWSERVFSGTCPRRAGTRTAVPPLWSGHTFHVLYATPKASSGPRAGRSLGHCSHLHTRAWALRGLSCPSRRWSEWGEAPLSRWTGPGPCPPVQPQSLPPGAPRSDPWERVGWRHRGPPPSDPFPDLPSQLLTGADSQLKRSSG